MEIVPETVVSRYFVRTTVCFATFPTVTETLPFGVVSCTPPWQKRGRRLYKKASRAPARSANRHENDSLVPFTVLLAAT